MNLKKPALKAYIILVMIFIIALGSVFYITRASRDMVIVDILVFVISMAAVGALVTALNKYTRIYANTLKELSDKAASLNILKSVLDAMDIFLYVTDIETDEVKFVNKPLMEHLNLTDSVIGMPCWKIFQVGYNERCDYCSLNKLLHQHGEDEGKPLVWEAYNTITGKYYRNIDRLIDWPDGKKVHFCQRIDMSETKKTQEMLIRMSSIVQGSPNYVAYQKITGECTFMNPAASALTGYSHEELMEDHIGLLFDEKTAAYLRNEVLNTIREKGLAYFEIDAKRKDGVYRTFSVCSFLIESEEKAFGTIATDITEKKQLENKMQETLIKAEQASIAKSDFLSRMSHEMRTPMNVIIGMARIGQKAKEESDTKECLKKISDAAGHLLGIINDILDMSKIEAGKMELLETSFALQDVLDQANATMSFKFHEKGQQLSMRMDSNVPKLIFTDKRKLLQVMINLLSNANKFTHEGGNIALRVRKTGRTDDKCKLLIEVEDDGIGVSEEQQERIFDVFEQTDNTSTRQYEGTGLGLAISRNMIEMMGGKIWVKSKPGKGTTFSFTINVGVSEQYEEYDSDEQEFDEVDIEGLFVGKRILLADDVEVNREILMALLADTGVLIDCAENGKEACDQFAANEGRYDLIFMDIHMPEMNGYEVTKKIREMGIPGADTIPIIAMTADVFSGDVEKCLIAGMNDHIGKPLDINVVITKMKWYLL